MESELAKIKRICRNREICPYCLSISLKAEIKELRKKFIKEKLSKTVVTKTLSNNQTVDALKDAYRKHVLMDDSIGWDELGSTLCDAICEEIGDTKFIEFSKKYSKDV